jgi:23S rRNA (guanine2445-N2)-methyltransferase / 23S rRNA (guanine2069-N7)-methyltransferase
MDFFATCPTGFEHLLANELIALELSHVRPLQGQVAFDGSLQDAYRACMWSRLASRIVVIVQRIDARTSDELYEGVRHIAWQEHLLPHTSFVVDATGMNAHLKNTHFTSLRTKDAIADALSARNVSHVETKPEHPDVRVVTRISGNRATIGIDLSGGPLFQRSYVRRSKDVGLRADYAAAVLALGQWHELCDGPAPSFVALGHYPDPLVVEAVLMAARYAPGLQRKHWGFTKWAAHEEDRWQTVIDDAKGQRIEAPTAEFAARPLERGVSRAKNTLRSLGIEAVVRPYTVYSEETPLRSSTLLCADLSDIRSHELVRETAWLRTFVQTVQECRPSQISISSRDNLPELYLKQTRSEVVSSMLGRDTLQISRFDDPDLSRPLPTVALASQKEVPVLVPASDQFAARLKKVVKLRAKWAKREDVSCYRLYDSDLPDYAVSIDLYQGIDPRTGVLDGHRWVQVYEYAAPKDVDESLARARLMDVLALSPEIIDVKPENTYLRVRKRDKGGSQYAGEARDTRDTRTTRPTRDGKVPLPEGAHLIDEGGLTFEVNFQSRLDCGIFLDHRDTRAMIREMAKQTKGSKRFLNLFAYTGTATCYAADGGMRYTTTVDLSRPSLDWARRNMARNGFTQREHEFVQADVIAWINEQRHTKNRWDLIFCDVPTFSNSNRMGKRSFDVQRDHAELLIGVSRLLIREGVCVFSCNLRSFKEDATALAKAGVSIEDITSRTIPEDFKRNPRIHHTYLVRRS